MHVGVVTAITIAFNDKMEGQNCFLCLYRYFLIYMYDLNALMKNPVNQTFTNICTHVYTIAHNLTFARFVRKSAHYRRYNVCGVKKCRQKV